MTNDIPFSRLCDILSDKSDALILFHVRPDGDAVGSAFALRLLLEALGRRAYCVCADEIPKKLRFLTDGIQKSVLPDTIPFPPEGAAVISVDTGSFHSSEVCPNCFHPVFL